MLNYLQLKSMIALSEYGNVKDAADALGVSRQTTSGNIKTLEERYGKLLFEKTGRQQHPTQALETLLPLAKQASKVLDEIEETLIKARSLEKAELSIGIGEPAIGVELISRFLRNHPGVKLQATEGNAPALMIGLNNRTLDVAVLALAELDERLSSFLLRTDNLRACVPVDHELASRDSIDIQELQSHRLIIGSTGTTLRTIINRAFFQARTRLNNFIEFDEWDPIIEATAQGLGVGIIQDNLVEGDTRLHSLVLAGADTSVHQYVVFPPENKELSSVQAFLDICLSDAASTHIDSERSQI